MNKIFSNVLFYIVLLLFVAKMIMGAGVNPSHISSATILGIPLQDISLLLALIIYFFQMKTINHICKNEVLILLITVGVFYYLLGVTQLSGNSINIMNHDLRIFLWLIGGISIGYLLTSTKAIVVNLKILLILLSMIIIIASVTAGGYYLNYGYNINRIHHPSIYIASGLMFPLIIISMFFTRGKLKNKLVPMFAFTSFIYFGVFQSTTRSLLIVAVVLAILLYISFNINIFTIRLRHKNISTNSKTIFLIIISVGVVIFLSSLNEYKLNRFSTIANMQVVFSNSRWVEVLDFFRGSSLYQLILGRGMGGRINSNIYEYDLAGTIHIGIMNFWLKFGVLPFLFVVYKLYYKWARILLNSYKRIKNSCDDDDSYLNFIFISSLVPWMLLLLMSGGYSVGNSMILGLVYYLYRHAKTVGISNFIKRL